MTHNIFVQVTYNNSFTLKLLLFFKICLKEITINSLDEVIRKHKHLNPYIFEQ